MRTGEKHELIIGAHRWRCRSRDLVRFHIQARYDGDDGCAPTFNQRDATRLPVERAAVASLMADQGRADFVHGTCEVGDEVGDAGDPGDASQDEAHAEAFAEAFPPGEVEDGLVGGGGVALGFAAEDEVGDYGGAVADEETPLDEEGDCDALH